MQSIIYQKAYFKVSDFVKWQQDGTLLLSPEFQRRNVWQKGAKSFLIDTIIKGLPIPIIFLRDRPTNLTNFMSIREVVDGQQRLRTVISYVASEYLKDYNPVKDDFVILKNHNESLANKSFKSLNDEVKQQILDYEFSVHVFKSDTDDRSIIDIFRRMNSTNYSLSKQELRNAQYYGEFKSTAYNLSAKWLQYWRKWKTFSENDLARMKEVEFVSECLIMISLGAIKGKESSLIDKTYVEKDNSFKYKKEIERRFNQVMQNMNDIFDNASPNYKPIFYKQTLIYTFFASVYNITFGLDSALSSKLTPKHFSDNVQSIYKNINDLIINKKVSSDVIDATQRRTTNIKERKTLYNFFIQKLKNA